MKVAVTGGTGMTGSYLLYKLLKKGYSVNALKRETSNTEITKNLFRHFSEEGEKLFADINWINGDVRDYTSVNELVKEADFVYHTAAIVSFNPKLREQMLAVNIGGTANVVNACLDNSVKKMCHVSSVAAIGNAPEGKEINEELEICEVEGISDYALSKYKSEQEVWRGMAEGLNAVILNPSIILGAGNWQTGSPLYIKTIWDGLSFFTTGIKGFVDVRDVAECMIQLTESEISAERYILNGENLPLKEVFDMIADNLNKKRPTRKASLLMLQAFRYFESLRYFITQKEPRMTKHMLQPAIHTDRYSNQKIKDALHIEFTPIKKSLEDICKIFLKEFHSK